MQSRTAITGALIVGTVLVAGPVGAVALNEALSWPRWQTSPGRIGGGALIAAGLVLALYCSHLFKARGDGTPVPLEPPRRLVRDGVYGYSRNPIYVADLTMLIGIFLHRGELALLLYAGLFALVVHVWIVTWEEPVLRERFGREYAAYEIDVPRWIGMPARVDDPR
jgi:protein-S-isoprenylcysteine O-methyltransferase Ste14